MADCHNIDIEEHDILENPLIKKIFPDITLIKEEIQAFFDEAQDIDQKEIPDEKKQKPASSRELLTFENEESPLEVVNYLKLSKDVERKTINASTQNLPLEENPIRSKIILGSKPNKKHNSDHKNILAPTLFDVKIQLQDVKSYLNRSNRFCRVCLTLFSNSHDIHKHNNKFHTVSQNKDSSIHKNRMKNTGLQRKSDKNKKNHDKKHVNYNDLTSTTQSYNIHEDVNQKNNDPNQCFHCDKKFENKHSLIEHIYNVLQAPGLNCDICGDLYTDKNKLKQHILQHKNLNVETSDKESKQVKRENNWMTEKAENLYVCQYCFCYFKTQKNCVSHLSQKHNVSKISKYNKKTIFNSHCKFCSLRFGNNKSYNKHIRLVHKIHFNYKPYSPKTGNNESPRCRLKKKENNDIIDIPQNKLILQDSLVLKSTIFKCIKCDVHFLSAKETSCHISHNEELINWKCSFCQRIFKVKDKILHLKQHTLSQSLIVYELSEALFSRVLYKCLKCAVHFTEHNFVLHYPICGLGIPNSNYCKTCDIIIDSDSIALHADCHKRLKLISSDFIVLDSDVLIIIGNLAKHSDIKKSQVTTKVAETINDINSTQATIECKEVKSYVNDSLKPLKSKGKKEGRTGNNLIKKPINANMSYCKTCKCFLISNFARTVHFKFKCKNMVKYVCKKCGLILTQKGMLSHKAMHQKYENLKLQDFNFFDMKTGVQMKPPLPDFPKCNNCGIHFLKKQSVRYHLCTTSEMEYLTCQICQLKLTEQAFKLHIPFHYYCLPDSKNKKNSQEKLQQAITKCKRQKNTDTKKSNSEFETDSSNDIKRDQETIIYYCKHCAIVFQTYDEVIEHCQNHYGNAIENSVINCTICGLNFESRFYEHHQKEHRNDKTFKIIEFDVFYFLSENNGWYKHIFDSLNQKQIENILKESIYSTERRIKMKVIQKGTSDVTVYQCDKCRGFVDITSVYMHTTYSCIHLKKYPCFVCGLLFVTTVSKKVHEKIHDIGCMIDSKSYRIVLFNQDKDKSISDAIAKSPYLYILYQCRNCNAIVDKDIFETHKCNEMSCIKCSDCGLKFFSVKVYESHFRKHKELDSFTSKNIKVILLGKYNQNSNKLSKELGFSFNGIICDYTFYQCSECNVCLRSLRRTADHVCSLNTFKSTCEKCDLFFTVRQMKNHFSFHESDPDFKKEFLNIIPFSPKKESSLWSDRTANTLLENSDKIVTLYKCNCGLHFLNEWSLTEHFNFCKSKNYTISKQSCSKCDLLFTPKILFTHLLKHHGNKNDVIKFDVIEVKEK